MVYEHLHTSNDPEATIPRQAGTRAAADTGPAYEDYDLTLAQAELDKTDWTQYPSDRLVRVRQPGHEDVTDGWKLYDVKTVRDEHGRVRNVASVGRWDAQAGSERAEVPFSELAALNAPEPPSVS